MSQRSTRYYAIAAGGSPQPVFGTKLTAAAAASKNPVTLVVADSSPFFVNEFAVLEPLASFPERQRVTAIPDSTHITVAALLFAHASGVYVALGAQLSSLYIQAKDGNVGALYIGNNPNLKKDTGSPAGQSLIVKLQVVGAGGQPFDFNSTTSGITDAGSASEWWIDGTTGDLYLPSFTQV
jgi:hypothetical protein